MTLKYTYEFVRNYFVENGCELLEQEYKSNMTKMKYRCKCGNEAEIKFSKFKSGQRCKKCSGKEKPTFENVYNEFKAQGCELLETEYINNQTKMKYICSCKNKAEIKYNTFKSGGRCMKCSGKETHTFEFVKEQFQKGGCELLENTYINNETKMKYLCTCGNESTINYHNFINGQRCIKCSGHEKHTYDYVYGYFKGQGCELLEREYINNGIQLKYRCYCGYIDYVTFGNFKSGCRCNTCCWDKRKETNLKRYGCQYPMQNAQVFENNKNSNFKSKVFEFSSGRIEKVQGYEPHAIDILLKEGYSEEDIVVNVAEMPRFQYTGLDDKLHKYYPDIYLKSENKIIEVKSEYTYKKDFERNQLKKACVEKSLVKFEFWILKKVKQEYKLTIL